MKNVFIGIDNGVTGTVGAITDTLSYLTKMPVKKEQNYTKAKSNISRVDVLKLSELIKEVVGNTPIEQVIVAIERPMVNPTRFKATTSALRALEATLIVVEIENLPFMYIDSKEWQKALLPHQCKGLELKKASLDIGNRLFPQFKSVKHPDRDGILIAEFLRRKYANKNIDS